MRCAIAPSSFIVLLLGTCLQLYSGVHGKKGEPAARSDVKASVVVTKGSSKFQTAVIVGHHRDLLETRSISFGNCYCQRNRCELEALSRPVEAESS